MNTLTNPLSDLIPARARKYVYSLATLAALVFSVWQASQGDWKTFVGGLFATLVPLLAASNTPTDVGGALDEVEDVADETDVDIYVSNAEMDAGLMVGVFDDEQPEVDTHDGHAPA